MRNIASVMLSLVLLSFAATASAGSAMARLTNVVDGNTLLVKLGGADMKVRLCGIVVPPADEKRPVLQRLNAESVAFLKKYLSDGWVYLEFPDGAPTVDKDGFVPAFVYRGSDATFLNEKLVSAGLAIVNRKEETTFTYGWKQLQQKAEASQRGIWGSFEEGSGEKIAAGTGQGNYIGEPGSGQQLRPSYVTYWIILY